MKPVKIALATSLGQIYVYSVELDLSADKIDNLFNENIYLEHRISSNS